MGKYKKVAFLFPGQGAQYPGMGKDFIENFEVARLTFEEADDILDRKISKVILDGPESLLTETKNSQTGIYVTCVALLRVIQKFFPDLRPSVCAGLSLGEFTAVTAADFLSFQNGLPLVQHRGQFMNDACESTKGTMAVILGMDAETVEKMVKKINLPQDLWAANFNCPGQVVISGTQKGIEVGANTAKAMGAKRIVSLQVHGAFHSGLMLSAEEKLSEFVKNVPLEQSKVHLVMNVMGNFVSDLEEIRSNLIKQVTSPLRWEQGIRNIEKENVDLYIEIGCGKTLTGFNKRIGVTAPTLSIEKVQDLEILAKELI
jgi:[acyl-carrier-protein] S-malonyltransferase